MKKELIVKVVDMEWSMFQNIPNIGGRAYCQEDKKTFGVMRSSQLMAWSEAVLVSYLDDLIEADALGMNLLTEKYARMMEFTNPIEYADISEYLLPLQQETSLLIEWIVEIHMAWNKEIDARFPNIRKRGRAISSVNDTPCSTSLETYLRGELATYSLRTLELYYQNVLEQKEQNINGAQIVLEAMIKQYGFNSLEEANKAMQTDK